ncbi:aminoglycoside phosphotransferase family protein [Fredinandcohnia humi]
MSINVPDAFKKKIIGAFGEEGKGWLHTIEERVQTCVDMWNLVIEGPVSNLSYNYVLKAFDSENHPVILKLGVPSFDFRNEIHSIEAYAGDGCAKVVKADSELGAMLLEQLVPGRMLSNETDEDLVLNWFVEVWKAIRRPVPIGFQGPTIMQWAQGLDKYLESYQNEEPPIPFSAVNQARGYFDEITNSTEVLELLHGDLHHENILYSSEKGWMAIDPKGLLIKRINFLCKNLSLNRERLLKAAVALATLYACWGIEDNDDWKQTYQCVEWFMELLNEI